MADAVLTWEQFPSFRAARKRFRKVPCIYVLTESDGTVLRIGESHDLWRRYNGGTGWMVEAGLHGTDKLIFGAQAPSDRLARRGVEAALTLGCKPRYCVHNKRPKKSALPVRGVEIDHRGDVPKGLC